MSLGRPISIRSVLAALVAFLFASAVYLYSFPSPNLIYPAIVLLHVLGGVAAFALLAWYAARHFRDWNALAWTGWALFGAGGILGVILIFTGTPHSAWNWMYLHILFSLAAVALLAAHWFGRRVWLHGTGGAVARVAICVAVVAAMSVFGYSWRNGQWLRSHVIKNHPAPTTMDREGDGPEDLSFPVRRKPPTAS